MALQRLEFQLMLGQEHLSSMLMMWLIEDHLFATIFRKPVETPARWTRVFDLPPPDQRFPLAQTEQIPSQPCSHSLAWILVQDSQNLSSSAAQRICLPPNNCPAGVPNVRLSVQFGLNRSDASSCQPQDTEGWEQSFLSEPVECHDGCLW